MAGAALRQTLLGAWQRRGLLAWLLWPLSLAYRCLWHVRHQLYRSGLMSIERVQVPVIVVGNVVAGGGGKTPLVIALVQQLQAMGLQPGVVSRGYGRTSGDCRPVTADAVASEVGDEPLLIHRRTGVPVQVATRRIDAARALLATHPLVNLLVCDDGLQHLGLHRDIEICVFDGQGIGNGFLLPAGPLREPWPRTTDLVVRSGDLPTGTAYQVARRLADHAIAADGHKVALTDLASAAPTRPIHAVAGIAHPQTFFAMLRERGLPLDATRALPDHAAFDTLQWQDTADAMLLCTEKDAVKLWPLRPDALAVPLEVTLAPAFWVALTQQLRRCGPDAWGAGLSSNHGHTPS
jgi:tetraacyldisaccharide 4'-kinase